MNLSPTNIENLDQLATAPRSGDVVDVVVAFTRDPIATVYQGIWTARAIAVAGYHDDKALFVYGAGFPMVVPNASADALIQPTSPELSQHKLAAWLADHSASLNEVRVHINLICRHLSEGGWRLRLVCDTAALCDLQRFGFAASVQALTESPAFRANQMPWPAVLSLVTDGGLLPPMEIALMDQQIAAWAQLFADTGRAELESIDAIQTEDMFERIDRQYHVWQTVGRQVVDARQPTTRVCISQHTDATV